jgi:hypothetical protein
MSASPDELLSMALAYATHGWPILPGTYRLPPAPSWRGRRGARGLEPITDDLGMASTDPVQVAAWWACQPYSVLLATGRGVDALELAGDPGAVAVDALRDAGLRGPAALTPAGGVLLLVASGARAGGPARWHGPGSWLPLPPTEGHRWRVAPDQVGWRLPDAAAALAALRHGARGVDG